MADPQKPNTTPTQPDAQPSPLIPVASFSLPAGGKIALPGRRGVHNGMNATKPSTGEFWSVAFDPRMRHLIVAYFKPGPDMKRAPADSLMIPEGMVTWRRAA